MFRIMQRYTDPITRTIKKKDITLSLEERRMENAVTIMTEPALIAYTSDREGEDAVYLNPDEYLMHLMDAKRTSSPLGCHQTYLTEVHNNNTYVKVFDAVKLEVFAGCPIAIMDNMDGLNIDYAIITEIKDNSLSLSNKLKFEYKVGAVVQNLSNRWWKYPLKKDFVGIKSGCCRPSPIHFYVRYADNEISIMINDIPNRGTMVAYDVYIRSHPFSYIEPHWIPDAMDMSIETTDIKISTYGGGKDCGGGLLSGDKYYVATVSKDKKGRVDVNESLPTIEVVAKA
jgi:hypothetical protein